MSTSTSLSVSNNTCNPSTISYFDLSIFIYLETIEIGSDNFYHTNVFNLDGLFKLRNLTIGSNSFTKFKSHYGNDSSKSFHILNCDKLESLSIGFGSFSDYGGEFELSNLPQLQSIVIGNMNSNSYNVIGNMNSNSYNFYYVNTFEIRGIELIFLYYFRSTQFGICDIRRLFILFVLVC